MKRGDKPTKEELAELETMKICRHKRRLWCEDCIDDTYKLHTVLGQIEGFQRALRAVSEKASTAFVGFNDKEAYLYRELVTMFRDAIVLLEGDADRLRKEQNR